MEKVSISNFRKMGVVRLARLAETTGIVVTWYGMSKSIFCAVRAPENLADIREIVEQLTSEFILNDDDKMPPVSEILD